MLTNDVSRALSERFPEVKLTLQGDTDASYMPKFFLNEAPEVTIGSKHLDSPHVFAHEYGHHQFDQTPIGSAVQHPVFRGISNYANIPLSALAGVAAARSDKKWAPYVGALAPVLTSLPVLGSEYMATRNAMGLMRDAGASTQQIADSKRELAGAYGSYATQALLAAAAYAAPFLAKKYWRTAPPPPRWGDEEYIRGGEENTKAASLLDMAPNWDSPVRARVIQGGVTGGAAGLLAGIPVGLLAPRLYGGSDDRLRGVLSAAGSMGLLGMGSGAIAGSVLGGYEEGLQYGSHPDKYDYDPIVQYTYPPDPLGAVANRLGVRDGERFRGAR
jgi:hypothetical protein